MPSPEESPASRTISLRADAELAQRIDAEGKRLGHSSHSATLRALIERGLANTVPPQLDERLEARFASLEALILKRSRQITFLVLANIAETDPEILRDFINRELAN